MVCRKQVSLQKLLMHFVRSVLHQLSQLQLLVFAVVQCEHASAAGCCAAGHSVRASVGCLAAWPLPFIVPMQHCYKQDAELC